ncbi:MAG: hypothetical protein M9921_10030 [Fimbriimonadaceae bacterium]|nr:hypothetical protein [Fimbriimonadaceae bacterium]
MKLLRTTAIIGCLAMLCSGSMAQGGLLGKDKGKGNPPQKSSPPQKSPPQRSSPPEKAPPQRSSPPQKAPPRNDPPPRGNPPQRNDPPIQVGNSGRGDRGNPPLGRIDRGQADTTPPRNIGNDDLLGRRNDDSRSGRVSYGTVNNVNVRNANPQSYRGGSSTIIDVRSGSLEFQVRREDNVRYAHRYRSGYVQYDSRWCDDFFYYPYYSFNPIPNQCVISPWYYYPQLPGYLSYNRIMVINTRPCVFIGNVYNWSRPARYGDNYGYGYGSTRSDLDYALDDLVSAFERSDRRAIGRLVPYRGRIDIALEGQFAYSLNADDFYDMYLDLVLSTRTLSYDILDVRTYRDEVTVLARHDYVDPWGRNDRVYHYYRLRRDRNAYFISEFGTSQNRFNY